MMLAFGGIAWMGSETRAASSGQQLAEDAGRSLIGKPAPRLVLTTIDGETIDRTEADRRFNAAIENATKIVDATNSNLDAGTRAALVSLTYNAGSDVLEFLAILSPAKISGPALIDVSDQEPWRNLRG